MSFSRNLEDAGAKRRKDRLWSQHCLSRREPLRVWPHGAEQGGCGEAVREASYGSWNPGKGLVLGGCVNGNQQASGARVTLWALPEVLSSSEEVFST